MCEGGRCGRDSSLSEEGGARSAEGRAAHHPPRSRAHSPVARAQPLAPLRAPVHNHSETHARAPRRGLGRRRPPSDAAAPGLDRPDDDRARPSARRATRRASRRSARRCPCRRRRRRGRACSCRAAASGGSRSSSRRTATRRKATSSRELMIWYYYTTLHDLLHLILHYITLYYITLHYMATSSRESPSGGGGAAAARRENAPRGAACRRADRAPPSEVRHTPRSPRSNDDGKAPPLCPPRRAIDGPFRRTPDRDGARGVSRQRRAHLPPRVAAACVVSRRSARRATGIRCCSSPTLC